MDTPQRYCFFCRMPLTVRHRATVFCSLRCQSLYGQTLTGEAPGKGRTAPPSHAEAARPEGPLHPRTR